MSAGGRQRSLVLAAAALLAGLALRGSGGKVVGTGGMRKLYAETTWQIAWAMRERNRHFVIQVMSTLVEHKLQTTFYDGRESQPSAGIDIAGHPTPFL